MALTGTIAFYLKNKGLLVDGSSIVASTGTDTANYVLGTNRYLEWESVGSDDTTTETLTITFPSSQTIDRIFLVDHNFKEFDIMYDVASTWTDFTTVVGLDGALVGGVSETTFDKDTAYYEFDSVTTTMIRIRATKTQVADEEKTLRTFIGTEEIGSLTAFPLVKNSFTRNSRINKTLSGRSSVIKSYDVINRINLSFQSNPYQNDQDIIETLYDSDFPFLVWLSGGKYGASENPDCTGTPDWFKIQQKGWDLKDIYQVNTDGQIDPNFFKNIFRLDTVFKVKLLEVVN